MNISEIRAKWNCRTSWHLVSVGSFSLNFKKAGGKQQWSVVDIFETCKAYQQMARHLMKDGSIHHSMGRSFQFGAEANFNSHIINRPRSGATVRYKSNSCNFLWIRLESGRVGLVIFRQWYGGSANDSTIWNSGEKKNKKFFLIPMQDGRNLARRIAAIHRCVRTVSATSGKNLNNNLQKKKKKPEIQVQMLRPDKISGVLREITYIGIVLLQERNYVPKDDFPIPLNYADVQRQTNTSIDVHHEATIHDSWKICGDMSLSEPWNRCDTTRAAQQSTRRRCVGSRQAWPRNRLLQDQETRERKNGRECRSILRANP